MAQLRRSGISLSLLLLAACGGKDPGLTSTSGSTGDSETGPGVTTTGLSMSSSPTTDDSSSGSSSVGATTTTTDPGTTSTTIDPSATVTSDPTTGEPPPACQIEQPRPGSCDGGAPKQPSVSLGRQLAPKGAAQASAGKQGPGGDDDEQFATTGEGCNFICPPDVPGANECDIFAQDCDPGEKCAAWANDGSSSWNSTKCVPVDAAPAQIGEPCVAEGGGVSGVDNCAKGAMCWDLGDDEIGTCVEVCSCSAQNPVCTTQNTTCTLSNDDVLALCLPVCDPLDPSACAGGDVCLAAGGASQFFICVLDASGAGLGEAGDPCEFVNACDPGLTCLPNSGAFPNCDPGSFGCCSPFCDLTEPSCPRGTACTPWYPEGTAPKCFEDVGVCG